MDSADSASRLASRKKAVNFTHWYRWLQSICVDLRWVSKRWKAFFDLRANLSRLTNNASRRMKACAFRVGLSRALRTWPAGSYFQIPARFFGTHERQRETFFSTVRVLLRMVAAMFYCTPLAWRTLPGPVFLNTLPFKLVSHSVRLTAVVRPQICLVILNFLSTVSPVFTCVTSQKNRRGGRQPIYYTEHFMVASRWYGLFDHSRIKPIRPLHRVVNTSLYTLNGVIRGNAR